jgi:RNA polymerase sigma-70 factor (ECF subfamily)
MEDGHELWQLLAGITMNKVRQGIEFHSAQKRHIDVEQAVVSSDDNSVEIQLEGISRDPSPDQAAIVTDEIDALAKDVDEDKRKILELRLQGFHIEEIAKEIGRSERTVRRTMKAFRERLEERLQESASL